MLVFQKWRSDPKKKISFVGTLCCCFTQFMFPCHSTFHSKIPKNSILYDIYDIIYIYDIYDILFNVGIKTVVHIIIKNG